MKKIVFAALALAFASVAYLTNINSAQAGVSGPAVASSQAAASTSNEVTKVYWRGGGYGWRGGYGGGWRGRYYGGWGYRPYWRPFYFGAPYYGPYCRWRCGPYRCFRVCY